MIILKCDVCDCVYTVSTFTLVLYDMGCHIRQNYTIMQLFKYFKPYIVNWTMLAS